MRFSRHVSEKSSLVLGYLRNGSVPQGRLIRFFRFMNLQTRDYRANYQLRNKKGQTMSTDFDLWQERAERAVGVSGRGSRVAIARAIGVTSETIKNSERRGSPTDKLERALRAYELEHCVDETSDASVEVDPVTQVGSDTDRERWSVTRGPTGAHVVYDGPGVRVCLSLTSDGAHLVSLHGEGSSIIAARSLMEAFKRAEAELIESD